MTAPKPRRPVTQDEAAMIRALAACTFLPASKDKKFARDVAWLTEITDGQAAYLAQLRWKYRRQIDASVPMPYIQAEKLA